MTGDTMRAAVLDDFGKSLKLKEISIPEPAVGEVVVRIHASSICDTDCRVSAVPNPVISVPHILGHQIAGTVCSVGSHASSIGIDSPVIVNFLIACGECEYCKNGADSLCDRLETIGVGRNGGFAEYIVVPYQNIIPIPAGCDMAEASFIGCGLATPLRALRQGRVQKGDIVFLIGEGLWTLGAIDLCLALGARPMLWSQNAAFTKKAQDFGLEEVTDLTGEDLGAWLASKSGAAGADLVIDFEATEATVILTQSAVRKGGRCVFVGHAGGTGSVTLPFPTLQFMESEFTGSCLIRAEEIREIIGLVEQEKLNLSKLITEIIDLEDINRGMAQVSKDSSQGIVVRMS